MRLRRTALALLAGVIPAAAAFAQDKPPGEEPKGKRKTVTLMPQEGGWKIESLFDSIHRATGISILFDSTNATFRQAKVEWIGTHVIAEDQLFDWLQAVLSYRKLVLVPVGPRSPDGAQQWFVMDQADPNLKSRPVYISEGEIEQFADRDGLYVVTTLTLEHISDTTRVRNALSPLSTATAGIGRIQDIPGSRALIVGDFAPVVAAMKRLLVYIDKENPRIEPRMEVVPLTYAVASELEPILSDLIQASDQRQQAPRQPGSPEEEPQPKIIADNRLDALIIYATESAMVKIKGLVSKLDVPSHARGRLNFRALKHTDAKEMADLLDQLISSTTDRSSGSFGGRTTTRTTGRRPTSPATGQQPGGGPLQSGGNEGAPVIIADSKSNSLIVQASPTQWEILEDLINKLDKSRPQVLIETSLVELTRTDNLDLGVELFSAQDNIAVDTDGDGLADAITNERKLFGASTFGGLTNIVSTPVGTGDNVVNVPTGVSPVIGTGFTAGIFKNGRLPIILNAFQSSGRGKILTMPSLVTNDNQKASITLERKTSFKETVRDTANTSTDSFKEITATTELSISPHISSDNYLRLEITQSVSNFIPSANQTIGAPPDQLTRKIDTNVTLPDAFTVVLGGLVQENESSSVSKVPFLGDLPVVGILFRKTTDTSEPSNLFLFVTPRILRDTERFSDYHKLTWETKLLQDDLFGKKVTAPSWRFRGAEGEPNSAADKLKALEDSGELDAGRLKAPLTEEQRIREAQETLRRLEKEKAGAGEQPAAPAAPAPPEGPK